jgi:RNA polymerase-binding transcription factor DksA
MAAAKKTAPVTKSKASAPARGAAQAKTAQAKTAQAAAKKAPAAKKGTVAKASVAKQAATAAKAPAAPKASSAAKKAPAAKKSPAPTKAPAADQQPAKRPDEADAGSRQNGPARRGTTKDGIVYTKDFDAKFLKSQRDLLVAERVALVGQADRLEDEANSLIEDGEMGDVQFDDESGEGDTMVVERERDLALSAQARQTVSDIDAALERLGDGTYGYSLVSGRPIPRERLEAIPWATELVEEKVGGIGRR